MTEVNAVPVSLGALAELVAAELTGNDGTYVRRALNGADFADLAAVRGNLGLGNAALRNVGTTSGTVADGAALAAETAARIAADSSISAVANAAMPKARIPWVDPRDYGAAADGATDDGAALQAAIDAVPASGGVVWIARGITYRTARTLVTKSNVIFDGGGTIKALPTASWAPATTYGGFRNVNDAASVKTDADMVWRNITLDWSAIVSGANHIIRVRMATRVIVENCTLIGLGSQTAFLACDDTWVAGNRYLNFRNCGADHWDGCNNNRVINNYFYTANSAQMVNWNPDPTTGSDSTGYSCTGFVMTGNVLVSTEASATPCQIEPLRSGAYAAGIVITGNKLTNCTLVLRGDIRDAIVADNEIADTQGTAEPITHYERFGQRASGIIISGNIIRGANTASPNLGVIRCQTDAGAVLNNQIVGTDYSVSPIYTSGYSPDQFGNKADNVLPIGYLANGFAVANGKSVGFRDAADGLVRWVLQTDNNLLLRGTNASGGERPIMGMFQRSDTSTLFMMPPMTFVDDVTETPARVNAAGTSVSTAATSESNWVEIISGTSGSAEAFRLTMVVGKRQSVTNSTDIDIKVFPRNSGSGQINGGTANASVTIPAGQTWQFMHFSADNYRVVAKG